MKQKFEAVTLVSDRSGFCFFYGDEGHKSWPKHVKKGKTHKEQRGFLINKYFLVTVREYCETTAPDICRQLKTI